MAADRYIYSPFPKNVALPKGSCRHAVPATYPCICQTRLRRLVVNFQY
jgi:hypothetical protein